MKHLKLFLKGLSTGFIDGEKKLLLAEEATATKEDMTSPACAIGWLVRCHISGALTVLAVLGAMAMAGGYFNEDEEE